MVAGLLLAALVISPPLQDAVQLQQSFWALVVNGEPAGDVLAVLDGDDVWLPVEALQRAGLTGFEGRRQTLFEVAHVLLRSLAPDVSVRLDLAEVVMYVTAAPRFFAEQRVALQRDRPDGIIYSHSPSGFLNYSATWDQSEGTSGFGEAGISFLRTASFVSGFNVDGSNGLVRGLSTLTVDRVGARQRWQVGDTVARATALGSAPIVAGISLGREYSVDPYYLRFPTPFFRGTATTRSNADVYVNGALVRRLQIGPGPYRLDRLPINTGLADVRVIVRDPLGRQQIFDANVYLAAGVLQKGEQDYQYVAGALREDSDAGPEYSHDLQAIVQHRVGVTNWFTVGAAAEGNRNVVAGGPAMSVQLGRAGEVDLNAWVSQTAGNTKGAALYGVYSFIDRRFNVNAVGQYFGARFANIYLEPGQSSTPEFYQLSVGVPVLGSGSLTYSWEERVSSAAGFGLTLPDGSADDSLARSRSHSLRLNFRVLPRTQLSASASYTDIRNERVWTGFASLNVLIGARTTASATYSRLPDESASFDVNRSLPVGTGYGYRLNGSDANGGTASGQFDLNTNFNRITLDYDATRDDSQPSGAITLAGGLIVAHGLFLTRPIETGTAVVEVTGLKRVRILADNVEVGRTNGRGRALIPNLLPYLANRISYQASDIPFDYRVPIESQLIAPPFRGAAYVRFPTSRIQGRTGSVRLIIEGEATVPGYGVIVAQSPAGDVESPLNAEGEFFLDLPAGHYRATVTFKGQSCEVEFDAAPSQAPAQSVGELRCAP